MNGQTEAKQRGRAEEGEGGGVNLNAGRGGLVLSMLTMTDAVQLAGDTGGFLPSSRSREICVMLKQEIKQLSYFSSTVCS